MVRQKPLLIVAAIVLWIPFFLINLLKPKREKINRYLEDQWEDYLPESWEPEEPFSIELTSDKNNPVIAKGTNAFSTN